MKYQHSSWHILEMIHVEEPKLLQNDKDGKMVSKCQNDEKCNFNGTDFGRR